MRTSGKTVRSALLPLLLGLCVILPLQAAQPMNLQDWRADAGTLTSASDGSMLGLSYATSDWKPIRLTPPAPLPLPEQATRMAFWFARQAGDFSLAFELRDAAGKTHLLKSATSRMTSDAVLWDNARRREWSLWNRAESAFFRAPSPEELAASVLPQNRAQIENALWPRPLTLTAIVIQPAKKAGWHAPGAEAEVKAGRGALTITGIETETTDGFGADSYWLLPERNRAARTGNPVLFPDDLTGLKGKVRYALELRRGYFGALVWSATGSAQIDPANPASLFHGRIELPALAPGRYFLSTKAWGADNVLEREQPLLTVWIAQQKTPVQLAPADSPLFWTTGATNNVFAAETTQAALTLNAAPGAWATAPQDAVCTVRVLRADQKTVFEQSYPRGQIPPLAVPVEAGEDYFAFAEIRSGEKHYDRAHLHFGVASRMESVAGVTVPPTVPARDEFLNGRADLTAEYWYGSRARTYPWFSGMQAGSLEDYGTWAGLCRAAGASVLAVGDKWAAHEILPGVYQWKEMEAQIAVARQHGMKVQFGYTADGSALGGLELPLWVEHELSRDQNGDINEDHSFWSPQARTGRIAYYQRLAAHFLSNPDVLCYRVRTHNLRAPGYAAIRLDYAAPAQTAFAAWLAQTGRTPTPMGKFIAIPGANEFQSGPDLSAPWSNFVAFNSYTSKTSALDQMQAIRSVDPQRMVIVDQKPFPYAIESIIPDLQDGGVLKNEDSPTFGAPALRSMCVQAGVPYVEELHNHLPTSRSIADATDFWSSYHSRTIFWLIRGRPGLLKDEPVKAEPNTWNQNTERWLFDYLGRTRAAWAEWIKAAPYEPQVLVFGSRAQGLLGNRRMGSDFDIGGTETFSSLMCAHQLPCHFADEYCEWVKLERFKLIFATAQIMPERAIARLADYAAQGGHLVLVGNAGDLCPERPGEREVLKKRVAAAANVRQIAAPQRIEFPGVQEWAAPYALDIAQLEPVLTWAAVTRPAVTRTQSPLGFETQTRSSADGKTVYVALMRRWAGWYWNNIEREEVLKEKYGELGGEVELCGLADGAWKIEKLHREAKPRPDATATGGKLTFALDPALAGEVQIFRLTRQ